MMRQKAGWGKNRYAALSRRVALCAVVILSCGAFVRDASAASRLSCALVIKSACGDAEPRGGRLRTCFESNMEKLAGPCGDKLSRAAATAHACEADARKFCGGVKRAVDVPGCMKPRLAEVGEPCKAALAKVGVKAGPKR